MHLIRRSAVVAAAALAACADAPTASAPPPQVPVVPSDAVAVLECAAVVSPASLRCAPPAPRTGAAADVIGGQGSNVRLTSSGVAYDSVAQVFAFDVTVQNLLVQRMGSDGATVSGVKVFFASGPAPTSGTGLVEVRNQDGDGFFTGAAQPYFDYPGALAHLAVSAPRRWELTVGKRVASFAFTVYVQTAVVPVVVFDAVANGNRDIWRVGLDGNDLVRLTTHAGDDRDASVGGRKVAFTSYRDGNAEIYWMPVGGGATTRMTATAGVTETDAVFSRDGTRLAYVSNAALGVGKVWTMNADGSGAARATASTFGFDGAPEAGPAWHPAGGRLALVATHGGSADVWDLTPPSAPVGRVIGNPAADVDPAWSPDGTRVAYASNASGDGEIYVLTVATGAVARLTTRAGSDAYPTWTPDGRIVYLANVGGTNELRWLDPSAPGTVATVPVAGVTTINRPYAAPF